MKLAVFCFVFYGFILIKKTTALPACYYESLRLKLAADADGCRKACAAFEFPGKGKCFAYVFDPEDETCEGYLFDHSDSYTSFVKCGINAGIGINSPSDDEGSNVFNQDSYIDSYYGALADANRESDGCALTLIPLGAAASKKNCKKLCEEIEDGDVYGGCLAWFYSPRGESCSGLLAKYKDNERTCSSL